MTGKETCRRLKDLRRQIAEENGIPWETEKCSWEGDCAGTCPRCDEELQALTEQVERRRSRKRAVAGVLAGTALLATLASCTPQVAGMMTAEEENSTLVSEISSGG